MTEWRDTELTRRHLLQRAGQGLLAATLAADLMPPAVAQSPAADLPPPVVLPPWEAPTEKQSDGPPTALPPDQRLGFAVVGLGRLSLEQILPAFGQSKRCKPVALVSGSPDKMQTVARQYGINPRNLYSYQTYDRLRDNPAVDIIYIVLPNSMHAEYTVRGAKAGKHILCEKPMATSVAECRSMIEACRAANRKLMIAYRMQYEPYNRRMIQMARTREFGRVKAIVADNGQNMDNPGQWRLHKALSGGGAMPDVGIYCLNAARYLTGEEPVEITARTYSTPNDPRFREVEETVLFDLRFPSGVLASCTTSYGYHETRRCRVLAEEGWFGLEPAFSYSGLRMQTAQAEGKTEIVSERRMDEKNQFALEMDHMAHCVAENRIPHTPGEEGMQDIRLIQTVYEAARSGRLITLPPVPRLDAFRGPAPAND